MATGLSEQEVLRRKALEELKQLGIDPYPAAAFPVNTSSRKIKENVTSLVASEEEVILAGRIMARRVMGKASFAEIKDHHGRLQVYINRDEICPGEDKTLYNTVFKKLLDIGDFIGVKGTVFKTQTGETSVLVKSLTVLAKSLRPLPVVKQDNDGNVYDGFTDPELRYRQRYVDLIVNDHVKATFLKRSKMMQAIREYLHENEAIEVDTPVLQAIPGGAAARPFKTHHNALDIPLYLRIANELYLKRLIVGGFNWVYEFSRNFRNEGMDRTHNPEFTVLEYYVAYQDYHWLMERTEEMLERVAIATNGTADAVVGERTISFKAPYQRVSIYDAIHTHTGFDVSEMNEAALRDVCGKLGIETNDTMGKGKLIDELFGEKCEHHYIQPTFITDYPVEMSPLTKKHRSKLGLVERFELIVNGKELANAYTELNDPIDQRERFEDQVKLMERGDDEAMYIDYDFLRALEYGMPPTAGIGFGIDRLAMMLTNQVSIQEVLLFPQMRPEKFEVAKQETANDFLEIGVAEVWAVHVKSVYNTVAAMRELKYTQVHQQLNGYRKKNKLDIPALQLEEVATWFA
ncbi:MAG: lysine--tRNA ligase [Schleiferiaceae bacterium]|nr:lysine--tRNA ligase [Schleiferiaceae bacterium]